MARDPRPPCPVAIRSPASPFEPAPDP